MTLLSLGKDDYMLSKERFFCLHCKQRPTWGMAGGGGKKGTEENEITVASPVILITVCLHYTVVSKWHLLFFFSFQAVKLKNFVPQPTQFWSSCVLKIMFPVVQE